MTLLAEPAGRLLERTGNRASRGMIVHDRTRLIGQLHLTFIFPLAICKKNAASTWKLKPRGIALLLDSFSDPLPGLNSHWAF